MKRFLSSRTEWAAPVAALAGSAALALKPIDYFSIAATGLVGLAGILAPKAMSSHRDRSAYTWALVVIGGTTVFWIGRLQGPQVGVRLTGLGILTIIVAAVAEEAFFRRFLYGWLERFGPVFAIAITSLVFAVIHVPTYGLAVLPIDIAAGAVLGWQRYATGGWTAPAITHVLANLMQMG